MRLGGDELLGARYLKGRADLLGGPLAEADVARLAGADYLAERLHRLLDGRRDVEAMALVEIDVVGAQARQRGVDLRAHLGCREAARVTVGHRPVQLRGQDVRVARIVRKDLAPGLLGGTATVGVRGVEEVDAGVERRPRAGLRGSRLTPPE